MSEGEFVLPDALVAVAVTRGDPSADVILWCCFLSHYGTVPQPPRRRGGSPVTPIPIVAEAVVVTNRGGFIQSMNDAATTLLGLPPCSHARPGQIGSLFVKGRVAIRTALREVLVGGPAVLRPASILSTGRALLPLTVSITALDDGFRWVLRPVPPRVRLQLAHALNCSRS